MLIVKEKNQIEMLKERLHDNDDNLTKSGWNPDNNISYYIVLSTVALPSPLGKFITAVLSFSLLAIIPVEVIIAIWLSYTWLLFLLRPLLYLK